MSTFQGGFGGQEDWVPLLLHFFLLPDQLKLDLYSTHVFGAELEVGGLGMGILRGVGSW
jgi:hypothetical protein